LLISVRQAAANEVTHVKVIREQAFASVRHIYRPLAGKSNAHTQDVEDRIDMIASVNGTDVGVIGLYREISILRLTGLAVLKDFRKHGVASQLVFHAHETARERGLDSLGLFTIAETGNVPIFRRLGFCLTQERVADWCISSAFDVLHEVEMRRTVVTGHEDSAL